MKRVIVESSSQKYQSTTTIFCALSRHFLPLRCSLHESCDNVSNHHNNIAIVIIIAHWFFMNRPQLLLPIVYLLINTVFTWSSVSPAYLLVHAPNKTKQHIPPSCIGWVWIIAYFAHLSAYIPGLLILFEVNKHPNRAISTPPPTGRRRRWRRHS